MHFMGVRFRRFPSGLGFIAGLLAILQPAGAATWRQLDLTGVRTGGNPNLARMSYSPRFTSTVIGPQRTNLIFAATDMSGIYRSVDWGETFQLCMNGWAAPGGLGFAIDPFNPNNVLGFGGGRGKDARAYGLYRSVDAGGSWQRVHSFPQPTGGTIAFDPSSYNQQAGGCLVAYWVTPNSGILKTYDAGKTWNQVHQRFGGAQIAVHPKLGLVYLSAPRFPDLGFWRSDDGGRSFGLMATRPPTSLAVTPTAPDVVLMIVGDQLVVSQQGGLNIRTTTAKLPVDVANFADLAISPTDPNHLLIRSGGAGWWSPNLGRIWFAMELPEGLSDTAVRSGQELWSWSKTDPDLVVATGVSAPLISRDGGRTFRRVMQGLAQPSVGGAFHFSQTAPGTVLLPFTDADTLLTRNGGTNWIPMGPGGRTGPKSVLGAYSSDGRTLLAGVFGSNNERLGHISADGGNTWTQALNRSGRPVRWTASDSIIGHAINSNALFFPGWRSLDGGLNWEVTTSCNVVISANPNPPHELLGRLSTYLTRSLDEGQTWKSVSPVPGGLTDAVSDSQNSRYFIASGNRLKQIARGIWTEMNTPLDQFGGRWIQTVAIDPVNPNILYAGGMSAGYTTEIPVVYSTDGGRSWQKLMASGPTTPGASSGPRQVSWMRVNPATRELWVGTQGYGVWVANLGL